SNVRRCASTSLLSPSGRSPVCRYALQAAVVMVKPGGTGSPIFVISARFAPLPPNRSLSSLLPSWKSYTKVVTLVPPILGFSNVGRQAVDRRRPERRLI